MSRPLPIPLEEVICAGNVVLATCFDCWHQRVLDPLPLARRCGAGATLDQVRGRLRCGCGSSRCWASVRLPDLAPSGGR